jgi:hypothetical protein
MAQMTFQFSDEVGQEIINALCENNGYMETTIDGPNPETKPQFAKRMVKEFMIQQVKTYKARQTPDVEIT